MILFEEPGSSTKEECIVYAYILWPLLRGIFCCILFWAMFRFSRNTAERKNKGIRNKCVYIWSIVFFVTVFIWNASALAYTISSCTSHRRLSLLSFMIYLTSYPMLWSICVGLLFVRTYLAFQDSELAYSSRTMRAWYIIYISYIVVAFELLTLVAFNVSEFWAITLSVAATVLLSVVVVVFINAMFVYKLIRVHRMVEEVKNEKMMNLITKTTLLAMISSVGGVLSGATAVCFLLIPNAHSSFFFHLGMFYDVTTNFLSIVLPLGSFASWYTSVCCHRRWKLCVLNAVAKS